MAISDIEGSIQSLSLPCCYLWLCLCLCLTPHCLISVSWNISFFFLCSRLFQLVLLQQPPPKAKEVSQNCQKCKGKKKENSQWGTGKSKEKAAADAVALKKEKVEVAPFVNPTPKGEKKDRSKIRFADAYHPVAVEAAWQDWWEASGFYKGRHPEQAMDKSPEEKFV